MNPKILLTCCVAVVFTNGCNVVPVDGLPQNVHETALLDEQSPVRLEEYLQLIDGTWVNEGYFLGVESGEILKEQEADLTIHIDPSRIFDHQALVMVSEYCRSESLQYLQFKLVQDRLELVGGNSNGCFFDLPRIDLMQIRYQVEGQDTVLVYEVKEVEYAHEQVLRLRKNSHHLIRDQQWSCGLQTYLNSILAAGQYEIVDAWGNLISREAASAPSIFAGSLEHLPPFSIYQSDYQSLCLQAETEIVVLGGTADGSSRSVFAIEWDVDEIRLYHTNHRKQSWNQTLPIKKETLAYVIRPAQKAIHSATREVPLVPDLLLLR